MYRGQMKNGKRPKKIRPSYRQHKDDDVRNAIRAAIPEGGVFWDYLCQICMEPIQGTSEFDRGRAEGMRACADNLLNLAMITPQEVTVKKNLEENDAI